MQYRPSLPQSVSATTPAFVAALALALLQQRERWAVYAALVPVMAGLVIATGAEPSFHVVGFAATLSATVLRALKTVIQVSSGELSLNAMTVAVGSCRKLLQPAYGSSLCKHP